MLPDKLEAFESIRSFLPSGPRRHVEASETVNEGKNVSSRKPERLPKKEYSRPVSNERSPLRCYGCGYGCGKGDVFMQTPDLHIQLQGKGCTRYLRIRDSSSRKPQELSVWQMVNRIQNSSGKGFLSSSGLVLYVKNTYWYFWDNLTHKYAFGEELDTPSTADMSSNTCRLRERDGESLTSAQKEKLCWNPSKMSSNQEKKQQISWNTTLTWETVLLSLYQLFLFVNVAIHQRSNRLLVSRQDAVRTRGGGCNKHTVIFIIYLL
ncbi:hypothetical protein TNCV_3362931 [Trichonephila clavipes]|nr:hypothetical protein TNCV_3362931 [Trichonephila clavipes]